MAGEKHPLKTVIGPKQHRKFADSQQSLGLVLMDTNFLIDLFKTHKNSGFKNSNPLSPGPETLINYMLNGHQRTIILPRKVLNELLMGSLDVKQPEGACRKEGFYIGFENDGNGGLKLPENIPLKFFKHQDGYDTYKFLCEMQDSGRLALCATPDELEKRGGFDNQLAGHIVICGIPRDGNKKSGVWNYGIRHFSMDDGLKFDDYHKSRKDVGEEGIAKLYQAFVEHHERKNPASPSSANTIPRIAVAHRDKGLTGRLSVLVAEKGIKMPIELWSGSFISALSDNSVNKLTKKHADNWVEAIKTHRKVGGRQLNRLEQNNAPQRHIENIANWLCATKDRGTSLVCA